MIPPPQEYPTIERCRRWLASNWLLVFLLTVCIARSWLMPLSSSFWTDEMGTAFVVQRPADASLSAVPQVPASIYYALPRAAGRLFGFSEVSCRLPSVLAMGIALFLVGRLAARLIDPAAVWFAVFTCLEIGDFNYYAADARPYALGICVAAASLYFLVAWLDSAGWKSALPFVILAALLWRVQLAFWAFYPIFAVYTIIRLTRSTTRVGWGRALFFYFLLGLTLIPVAIEALGVLRNAKSHVFAQVPSIRSLPGGLSWKPIAVCVVLAALFGGYLKWQIRRPASTSAMTLILSWWLWMPLCFFVFSRATGTVLFVPRYFSPALPGAALAATTAIAFCIPRGHWKQAAVAMAAAALITANQWNVLWPHHGKEGWRQASADVDLAAEEPDTPVIAISPFVEAQPPVWSLEYQLPGFLYAPLFVYPARGRIYPFPYVWSPAADPYAVSLLRDTLLKRTRFIVYGAGRNTLDWIQWFASRPELAGWRYDVDNAQAVGLAVFENPAFQISGQ